MTDSGRKTENTPGRVQQAAPAINGHTSRRHSRRDDVPLRAATSQFRSLAADLVRRVTPAQLVTLAAFDVHVHLLEGHLDAGIAEALHQPVVNLVPG